MSPAIKTALLCEYAFTASDGKLSIIGIFSNINFPTLPNVYPRFFVVVIVTLDRGLHAVRLRILDPIGQQLIGDEGADVQVESTGGDTNLVVDFNNLPFERPGIYQVQLLIEGTLVHSVPLSVQGGSAASVTAQAN